MNGKFLVFKDIFRFQKSLNPSENLGKLWFAKKNNNAYLLSTLCNKSLPYFCQQLSNYSTYYWFTLLEYLKDLAQKFWSYVVTGFFFYSFDFLKGNMITLNSLISTQQILFFLRKFSHLHALLEPTRLFIFGENSHLHDY